MKRVALFLAALPLCAQSLSLTLKGLTPTQATIVYHQSGTCTPTVTSLASGAGFYGALTRGVTGLTTSTLLDGSTMLVIGSGAQQNLLQFNAAITVSISCNSGAETGSISFTTPNPQPGDGVRHTMPYNAASNGNYDLPSVNPNVRGPVVLENGATVIPVTQPGWFGQTHHGVKGTTTLGGSGWTNVADINTGVGTGTLASVSGTGSWTSSKVFVPFADTSGTQVPGCSGDPYVPLMYGPTCVVFGGWNPEGFSLDDLRSNFFGTSSTGAAKANQCFSLDGATCKWASSVAGTLPSSGTGLQAQFPSGANWPGTTLGQGCYWCDQGIATSALPQQWQLSVSTCPVSVSSSVVTATTGGPDGNGQGCFNIYGWGVGAKYYIAGSSPTCTNNLCTIASFQSSSQFTISESLTGFSGVLGMNSPGILYWITDTVSSSATLSVSMDYAYSANYVPTLESNQSYCNSNPQTVTYAADGATPIAPVTAFLCATKLNAYNYNGAVGGFYFLFPSTGEIRFLTPFYLYNGSEPNSLDRLASNGSPGIFTLMFTDFWDIQGGDPNVGYFSGTTTGANTSLFRFKYDSATYHWKAYAHTMYPADDAYTYLTGECAGNSTGGQIWPGQDCTQPHTNGPQWSDQGLIYTNLTKASAGISIDQQILANNPSASSTLFIAPTPQRFGGGAAVYISYTQCPGQPAGQHCGETVALYDSFPTSATETSAVQIAATSSVAQYACAEHANDQFLTQLLTSCNPLGGTYNWSGGTSIIGIGPFQTTPSCMFKASVCNSDTSMTPTAPFDTCPSPLPAIVQPYAFTLTNAGTPAATNGCVTLQFQMPCSHTPASGEAAKWPCDQNGAWSEFRPTHVGDAIAIDYAAGLDHTMELLLQVSVLTPISGTTYQAVFMRGTEFNQGAAIGGPLNITNGWTGFLSPPTCSSQTTGSTCGTGIWANMGQASPTWLVDPGGTAGHFDIGNSPSGAGYASFFQPTAGRYNLPFPGQIGQAFSTSLTASNFAGQPNAMTLGVNVQAYPGLRQVAAVGAALNTMTDATPPNPSGGSGPEIPGLSCGNTFTNVGGAGFTTVYLFTGICGPLSYKKAFPQFTAGPYLLKDITSPATGNTITDSTPWEWCYVYLAGECHSGSTVNTAYAAIPGALTTLGGCGGNWFDDIFPCGLSASPLGGTMSQWRIDNTDLLGTNVRNLGTGGVPLGTGYQFTTAETDPSGSDLIYQGNWGLGWMRNDFYMMVMPPTPGSDTINRTQFIPLTVTVPPGTCGASCFAQFGYAQYSGSALTPANLYCSPRSETCTTDATGAAPWLYTTSDTQQPTSCASGCKLTINLMPGMGEAWYSLNGTGPLVQIQ